MFNAKAVIFQNIDNRNLFIDKGIVPMDKTYIVNGSGVDIEKFYFTELPETNISFLLVSRLLGEKGLREYAEAARIVKNKFPDVKFNLVGGEDASLDAISINEVYSWSNYIDYHGSTDDVRKYMRDCHVNPTFLSRRPATKFLNYVYGSLLYWMLWVVEKQ